MLFFKIKILIDINVKKILKNSKNVLISPLAIKFSYNFFNFNYKLISLIFMNKKSESGNIKLTVSNLPENFSMNSSIEIVKINQNYLNENHNNPFHPFIRFLFCNGT